MKNELVLMLLSMILLFGCVDLSGGTTEPGTGSQETEVTEQESGEEGIVIKTEEETCDASYAFSKLSPGVFSESVPFAVTATCAKGKYVSIYLNDRLLVQKSVSTNDPEILDFDLSARSDGTNDLEVKAGSEVVYSETWDVLPLGSTDTRGKDYDQVSNKKWIATALDVDNIVDVNSIGAYMKRLEYHTLQDSYIVAEIRADVNNNPSDEYISKVSLPITDATMTENWLYFNLARTATLEPGRYWVVFYVIKEEPTIVGDTVNLHYIALDNTVPPDGKAKQMSLSWSDSSRNWEQSTWEHSKFKKTYSVFLSTNVR